MTSASKKPVSPKDPDRATENRYRERWKWDDVVGSRDRLRDLVTEQGHFVDEVRGVAVHVEPRFRKEYDAERLVAVFPRLAGCAKSDVDTGQLEACVTAGMVTETELERSGVLTRSLHSRALIVKPLGQRPAGVTR